MLKGVREGYRIEEWNSSCPPDKVVKAWDRLLFVNDQSGNLGKLVQMMQVQGMLKLTFQRPTELKVQLQNEGGIMSIGLSFYAGAAGLVIAEVKDGLLKKWCQENKVHIKASDRIRTVNGLEGSPDELLRELQTSTTLELDILMWQ
ncbi:unnamed protein product [Polarella glacialis]|nr:unnamed protein product [Polarella glacialis]